MQINQQRGFGLIEVVASIVIISIALTSIVSILMFASNNQIDPVRITQAKLIAQNEMDKIIKTQSYKRCGPVLCELEHSSQQSFVILIDVKSIEIKSKVPMREIWVRVFKK